MKRAHSGVSIFVKNNLRQSLVDVNCNWQMIVVTLHTTITFCNLYIPPSTAMYLLAHIFDQLPKPSVIAGILILTLILMCKK